eukprot:3770109-Amphidinium_carterae.1
MQPRMCRHHAAAPNFALQAKRVAALVSCRDFLSDDVRSSHIGSTCRCIKHAVCLTPWPFGLKKHSDKTRRTSCLKFVLLSTWNCMAFPASDLALSWDSVEHIRALWAFQTKPIQPD